MKDKAVLFIDDEENILKTIRRQLQLHGYQIYTAINAEQAYSILENEDIHVVISDQRMPSISGVDLLAQIKNSYPKTVRMILSGYSDFDVLQEAINNNEIYRFIPKPWEEEYLIESLQKAFTLYEEQERTDIKNRVLDNAIEGVVITNVDLNISTINLSFQLLSGYSKNELNDVLVWDLFSDLSQDKTEIHDELKLNKMWQGETKLTTKSNASLNGLLSISEINDKQRNTTFFSFSFINIPELKEKNTASNIYINIDLETELLNKNGFESALESILFSNFKNDNLKYIVIFYFENFSLLSNTFGSDFSAEMASSISAILKNNTNHVELYGRISQNNFALLIGSKKLKEELIKLLDVVLSRFSHPIIIKNQPFYLCPSVGVSVFPDDSTNARILIDNAKISAQYSFEKNKKTTLYSQNIDHELKNRFNNLQIVNPVGKS